MKVQVVLGVVLVTSMVQAFGGEKGEEIAHVKVTEDQPPKFTLSSKTSDGTAIYAEATMNKLLVSVKGNLEVGISEPLMPYLQMLGNDICSEEEIQLLEASGNFVKPYRMYLEEHEEEGVVSPSFLFLGEENDMRRIRLTVTLKDFTERILVQETQLCEDQRIWAKKNNEEHPNRRFRVSPISYPKIEFDKALVEKVQQIEVIFENISLLPGGKTEWVSPSQRPEFRPYYLACDPNFWSSNLGKQVAVKGVAVNSKIGAGLKSEHGTVWIDDLTHWPKDALLKIVRVSGTVVKRHDGPQLSREQLASMHINPVQRTRPLDGIGYPEGSKELHEARKRYLLKNIDYAVIEDNPAVLVETGEYQFLDWNIKTSKATFFPGEPVLLTLNIKNNGKEEAKINFGLDGIGAFSIEIWNSANKVVAQGGNIQRYGLIRPGILEIPPGESGLKSIVLNQWCSTLLPIGKYHIICHVKYAAGTDLNKVVRASLLINGYNRIIDLESDIEVISSDDSKFIEILDGLAKCELKTEKYPTKEWNDARAIAREMIAFTESDLAVPYQLQRLKDMGGSRLKWDTINLLARSGTLEAAKGLMQILEDPSIYKEDMEDRIIDAIYRLRETGKAEIINFTDEFVIKYKRPILSEPMD